MKQSSRSDISGLEIRTMALSLKILLTLFAVLSVAMVTMVYALLIKRSRFMSTTALFPAKAIEKNTGNLLSMAWPDSTDFHDEIAAGFSGAGLKARELDSREDALPNAITLFYLGRMRSDTSSRVAKGVLQSSALPLGEGKESRPWLTSGSPTTRCIVQLLIWEWVSLWLILLMLVTILAYNGFLTNQRALDSLPRLFVSLIYALTFAMHAFYTWRISLRFFTKVAAGCSWSLIERGNFAIAETAQLNSRVAGEPFHFRSIDKASEEHEPKNFIAHFEHETPSRLDDQKTILDPPRPKTSPEDENVKDLAAAEKVLLATQITERETARTSANESLSRIVSNAMIIMGIILSCGFSSWTAHQATENTPNNFSSAQIGSLALLGALSTGSALLFSSALHLSMMEASFHAILSLRELRINGKAIDHFKKRSSLYKSVAFLDGNVPLSPVRIWDILGLNKRRNYLTVLFVGPALGLLPNRTDFERQSEIAAFDLRIRVRGHFVILTTRQTRRHMTQDTGKAEVINVCRTG